MNPVPLVHLIVGDVRPRVHRAEAAAIEAALGGPPTAFSFFPHSASDGGLAALDAARTVPMMVRRKVVLIRDVENATGPLLEALLDYCERPAETTTLLLTGEKLPPGAEGKNLGRRLENLVQKMGKVERFKSEDQDPVAFVIESARALGCRLDRPEAQLLVQFVGRDLGLLEGEVAKASLFVGGSGTITASVVEAVCSVVADADSWQLTDALVRRDADLALSIAHRLLEEGESTHKLLGMITWQFRQLLILQDCMRRGVSEREGGVRMPPNRIQVARAQLRQRPLGTARLLEELARANRDLNRSRAGDRRVFEMLVLSLVAG